MGALDDLKVYDPRERCAEQKWQMDTRVDASDAKDREDKRRLEVWRSAVYAADRYLCRCCGLKVKRTLKLTAERAEAHHVAGRADVTVRYDPRNGLTLCYKCHRRVTGNVADKLVIVGSVFFTIETTRYIDAREPVEFQEAA